MGVYAGTKNAVRTISEALRQESAGRWRVTGISGMCSHRICKQHKKQRSKGNDTKYGKTNCHSGRSHSPGSCLCY